MISTSTETCTAEPREAMDAHYEAVTPRGPVRLIVLGEEPVRRAIDAAIALDDCAAVLDELDAWVGDSLEWHWCGSPPSVSGARLAAVWSDGSSGGPPCRIEMPWAMLRALPAPPTSLQSQLSWPRIPVVLDIARFDLEPGESLALEPGGAVILPDSFGPQWRGRLRAAGEPAGAGVSVSLGCPGRPRVQRMSPDRCAEAAPRRYEVCLLGTRPLDADLLAGWAEWDFDFPDTPVRMWRCSSEEDPAECVATGHLIPWGSGFALAVEAAWEPQV